MASTYTIASDLSYFVLQKQRREGEIPPSPVHQSHEHPQAIRVIRRLRDLDEAMPEDGTITPIWHRHRGGRR